MESWQSRVASARELLSCHPGANKRELKRHYLRATKTCPPETDPEGFKRVRAAYELLVDDLKGKRPLFEFVLPDIPSPPDVAVDQAPPSPQQGAPSTKEEPTPTAPTDSSVDPLEAVHQAAMAGWKHLETDPAEATKFAMEGVGILFAELLAVPPILLDLVFALYQGGHALGADGVMDGLADAFAISGESKAVPQPMLPLWFMLQELRGMDALSPQIRRLLAAGLETDEWVDAERQIESWSASNTLSAETLWDHVASHPSPFQGAVLNGMRQGAERHERAQRKQRREHKKAQTAREAPKNALLFWGIIGLSFLLIYGFWYRTVPQPAPQPVIAAPQPPPVELLGDANFEAVALEFAFCQSHPKRCEQAMDASLSIETGNCLQGRAKMNALIDYAGSQNEFVRSLQATSTRRCLLEAQLKVDDEPDPTPQEPQ